MTTTRKADHPIQPIFLERWSPRSFDPIDMPAADLMCMLEAARWAPSAFNIQPWRFLYSRREDVYWSCYLDTLDAFNRSWANQASALVAVLSNTITPSDHQAPLRSHSLDAGAAWAHLALQATSLGYQAHAMAGIDLARAREALNVPDNFCIQIIIAIGKKADPARLPEELRKREIPSDRLPLNKIAFAGGFPQ